MRHGNGARHRGCFIWAGVVALVLVVAAGVGVRVLLLRVAAPMGSSVFNQLPAPSTNQPIGAGNLARLHPVWTYTVTPAYARWTVVANGVVYQEATDASSSYVVAIQDGKEMWRHTISDPSRYVSAECVEGQIVYVATARAIYAIDARTGDALWHYEAGTQLDLTAVGNKVFCTAAAVYFSTTSQINVLDAATGKPLWSYRYSADPSSAYSPFAPALVADDTSAYLFLTTSPYVAGPAVTALDARTGAVRWQLQELDASTLAPGVAPLVGANGAVYRPLREQVAALDAATGKTLWTTTIGASGRSRAYGMSLDAARLYVTGPGYTQAFELTTGSLVWQQANLQGAQSRAGPVVSGGVVYVATDTPFTGYGHPFFQQPRAPHWLYAYDASTGRLLRMLQENDSTFEPSLLAADATRLYVAGTRSFAAADPRTQSEPTLYALGV